MMTAHTVKLIEDLRVTADRADDLDRKCTYLLDFTYEEWFALRWTRREILREMLGRSNFPFDPLVHRVRSVPLIPPWRDLPKGGFVSFDPAAHPAILSSSEYITSDEQIARWKRLVLGGTWDGT